jgi:hypothetical protein
MEAAHIAQSVIRSRRAASSVVIPGPRQRAAIDPAASMHLRFLAFGSE